MLVLDEVDEMLNKGNNFFSNIMIRKFNFFKIKYLFIQFERVGKLICMFNDYLFI